MRKLISFIVVSLVANILFARVEGCASGVIAVPFALACIVVAGVAIKAAVYQHRNNRFYYRIEVC